MSLVWVLSDRLIAITATFATVFLSRKSKTRDEWLKNLDGVF